MWGAHDGMGWWMLVGLIWMLLFWGGLAWLVVWGLTRRDAGRLERDTPLEIAKGRYARGEITREEFEQLRRDLS